MRQSHRLSARRAIANIFRAVYPLDTVKTRLQALPAGVTPDPVPIPDHVEGSRKHPRASSIITRVPNAILRRLRKWQMLSMLIRILRTEGLTGAFKGFTANMLNTFSMRKFRQARTKFLVLT